MPINSANELLHHFNIEYGIEKPWPKIWYVNDETYADCCQTIFNWFIATNRVTTVASTKRFIIHLPIGENGGLIFKNVELLRDTHDPRKQYVKNINDNFS